MASEIFYWLFLINHNQSKLAAGRNISDGSVKIILIQLKLYPHKPDSFKTLLKDYLFLLFRFITKSNYTKDKTNLVQVRKFTNYAHKHDGASPQFGRQNLNEPFPERRIGGSGRVEWSHRSPEMTPKDFFLRISKKYCVHKHDNKTG